MATRQIGIEKLSYKPVTILVALYKAGKYIKTKLKNLEAQTSFNKCNIILLNCQNLDKESELYDEFIKHNNVAVIEYDKHIKLYNSWNDGITLTKSKYICNSNADDLWDPEYITTCLQYLEDNPENSVVSTYIHVTDIPNQDWPNWKWISAMPEYTYPQSTAGPCPMWRRELHDKYGYFEDYWVISDARAWEKWHSAGEKFALIDKYMVLYCLVSDSLERRHADGKRLIDIDLAK